MNNGKSTSDSIVRRIRGHGRGWIFTTSEFLDLGAESALKKTLSRLSRDRIIRRLTRGVYDYPRIHRKLGILSPNPDDVAAALAASTGSRVQISGGRAANLFGLTTQVPAQLASRVPEDKTEIPGQSQVSREPTLTIDSLESGAHRERNYPCTTFPIQLLVQRSSRQQ